jgi:hypothetical protein
MRTKPDSQTKIASLIAIALLAAGGFFYATKSFSHGTASDIAYFKGNWVVALRSNPQESFSWTVKDDLQGGWMVGVVEKNGEKVSTDFWRQSGKRIERFAFTSGGAFVKIESSGWESDRLVMTGVTNDKTGETKIRETITRTGERRFQALWEKQTPDGKWIVFADEICTK